jgi:MFS family permease
MSEMPAETATPPTGRKTTTVMWMALLTAFLGWMFDGMEMGLFGTWARPALTDLLGTDAPGPFSLWNSITLSLFLSGMAVGGVIFGRLGDRIGRVRTLVLTILIYAVFTGLTGFVRAPWQFAACRFFSAVGLGGEWGLGVALVMETWPRATRPVLAGLLGAAANFGFFFSTAIGLLAKLRLEGAAWAPQTLDRLLQLELIKLSDQAGIYLLTWRPILMAGFIPALLTVLIRLGVRESQRWVESQQRGERSSFGELFSPALRRRTLVGAGLGGIAVLGMWGSMQTWMQGWVRDLVPPDQVAGSTGARPTPSSASSASPSCSGSTSASTPIASRSWPWPRSRRSGSRPSSAGCRCICRSCSPRGCGPRARGSASTWVA